MVGAIRVAGSPGLRALVGRATESRGQVEADLMSSTSSDVCELWNGDGVVRVLGRPVLLLMIRVQEAADTCGIYTFKDAIEKKLYTEKDTPVRTAMEEQLNRHNPPNLSLNVSMIALPRWMVVMFILIGVLFQGGVVVYAVVAQYVLKLDKNDKPVSSYVLPLFVTATLFLALGMFLCAEVVETSTAERIWIPDKPETTDVIWLQQGGQTVGDQRFESFARCTRSGEIITSTKSQRINGLTMLLVSLSFALAGFVGQFIALRAMHATVIVAQLGAILVMTAIRACAHIQRDRQNDIDDPEEVEGHELDWLAKKIHGCLAWEVAVRPELQTPILVAAPNLTPTPQRKGVRGWISSFFQVLKSPVPSSTPVAASANLAIAVMQTRARLAELSEDWDLQLRDSVARLQTTLDRTMNEIYATTTLKNDWKTKESFQWSLPVQVRLSDSSTTQLDIMLTMTRVRDLNRLWGQWGSVASDLEAVMSLWMSSMIDKSEKTDPIENMIYLGLATPEAVKDYQLWIQRQTTPETAPLSPTARYFGYLATSSPVDLTAMQLCIPTKSGLDMLCAGHIYTAFMSTIATEIVSIGGNTERRATEETAQGNVPAWMHFRLSNTKLAALTTIFSEAGLGTIEEAYFSIILAFRPAGIVPSAKEACREARQAANGCEQSGNWVPALEIDGWLCQNKESTGFDEAEMRLMFEEMEHRVQRLMVYIDREFDLVKKDQLFTDFLVRLWDGVSILTGVRIAPAPYSYTMAWCTVWLCKNIPHHTTSIKSSDVLRLCAIILATMDLALDHHLQLVMQFISLTLQDKQDPEAEALAVQVWNTTAAATDSERIAVNFTVSQALLTLRQIRNVFMAVEDVRNYLVPPPGDDRLRRGQVTAVDMMRSSIDLDLLLISPYRTQLQCAAEAGRLDLVKLLVSSDSAAVNGSPISSHGRTALQAAAGQGHCEVVEYLISSSADIHYPATAPFGRTALQAASEGGHTSVVELLLTHSVSPNEPPAPCAEICSHFRGRLISEKSETAGDPELYTPAHIRHTAYLGVSALQAAARNGHENIVGLLLTAGANANTSAHGTALQAAATGHLPVVKTLLAAGADVNIAANTCGGRTALQAAAESGRIDIVLLLLQHKALANLPPATFHGRTALAAAAGRGHLRIVELLLPETANINATPGPSFGATSLQAAARSGHTGVVEILLDAGADPNAFPALIGGRSALAAAAGAGHSETVAALLKRSVLINAPASYSGRTALQAAAEGGYQTVVELLLKERADVNAPAAAGKGLTALTAAAGGGYGDIVQLLLRAKAQLHPGSVDAYGHAMLEMVAGDGEVGLIGLWLNELRPSKEDTLTPLEAAVSNGHVGIVELLLKGGAKVRTAKAVPRPLNASQFAMMRKMSSRGIGCAPDANGRTVKINPPLRQQEMATAAKMGGHYAVLNGYIDKTAIERANLGGNQGIIEMLALAAGRERSMPNPMPSSIQSDRGLVTGTARSGSTPPRYW